MLSQQMRIVFENVLLILGRKDSSDAKLAFSVNTTKDYAK